MFVTGLAELLSADWVDALHRSTYGRWLLAGAFVLTMALLGEWVFARFASKRPAGSGSSAADAVIAREPVLVDPPVTGRWQAANSPADKVPSHGTHWGGQSHAIDIKRVGERAEDEESSAGRRSGVGSGLGSGLWRLHRPEEFPAYGSPVSAPADGTVVEVVDTRRDHRARTSLLGLLYFLLVEQLVRSFAPRSFTFGNHVVLRLEDGADGGELHGEVYAGLCHLRRGSITVEVGDRVQAGQLLGECGNSGNSTEPHLHFQLMDSPGGDSARGIPFSWRGVGVPRGGEEFTVETAPTRTETEPGPRRPAPGARGAGRPSAEAAVK